MRTGWSAPGHHKGGWHLTGTLGTIAAGVAGGKLLGLDPQRLTYAMGIATTQAAGIQQNRGTMCKSFHAGKSAANGVLAALLAERGFDSTQEIIEGKKGFARVYSDVAAPEELNARLDQGWLIETNGHKPYACGVVLHPLIDAVIAIRNRDRIDPATVSKISLRVHPFVLSITDVVDPSSGLQSKFSTLHSAAVALVDGDCRHRAVFRRPRAGSAGGGAARQGDGARRRNARQGRGLCGDRGRQHAPRNSHPARHRHRRQSR